ncbi:MAG: hypothetical protein GY704_14880, partial [Phycisphaeraceae bacterium]|nr:hypothetical protein [Phycisphaeraceae bacterium]
MIDRRDELTALTSEGLATALENLDRRLSLLLERLDDRITALPLSATFAIPETDLLAWLKHRKGTRRQYWSSRQGDLELAGSGTALEVASDENLTLNAAYADITAILARAEQPDRRFLGGQVFDPASPLTAPWSRFSKLSYAIPAILLSRRDTQCSVTITTKISTDSTPDQVRSDLRTLAGQLTDLTDGPTGYAPAALAGRADLPEYAEWRDGLERMLTEIDSGALQKIVLARRTDLTLDRELEPTDLLAELTRRNPNCFGF